MHFVIFNQFQVSMPSLQQKYKAIFIIIICYLVKFILESLYLLHKN